MVGTGREIAALDAEISEIADLSAVCELSFSVIWIWGVAIFKDEFTETEGE